MSQVKRASFVVRVAQGRRGEVSGVIERAATGAKEAFTGMDAIGQVILRMLLGGRTVPRAGPGPAPARRAKPSLGECPQGGSGQTGTTD